MKLDLYPFKLYIKKISVGGFFGAGLLLNIALWVWLWMRLPKGEEHLFLHYNILFGVDYTGEWWKAFYMPLLGLSILILNFILGWIFYRHDKFISQMLNFIALVCQIFLLISIYILVFLNV